MRRYFTPDQIEEFTDSLSGNEDVNFGVDFDEILKIEINNPRDLERLCNLTEAVWPCCYVEDGKIVLESCYGSAEEDRVTCARVFIEEES
jgi:hypothetical protein